MNLHPSLLVCFDFQDSKSSTVRDPSTKKVIASCTNRESAEAAARLLLWDHEEWYGPPKKSAYEILREAFDSAENTW